MDKKNNVNKLLLLLFKLNKTCLFVYNGFFSFFAEFANIPLLQTVNPYTAVVASTKMKNFHFPN